MVREIFPPICGINSAGIFTDVPFRYTLRCMIGHKPHGIDAGSGICSIPCGKKPPENGLWKTIRIQESSCFAF